MNCLVETLLCCDGASLHLEVIRGWQASYGFLVRDHIGTFVFAESGGMDITTNYIAEFLACIRDLDCAIEHQELRVILQNDSKACITAFMSQKLPWNICGRWKNICCKLHTIHFRHTYREANFSADYFKKKGVSLQKGQEIAFNSRPNNLVRLEFPNTTYIRFTRE